MAADGSWDSIARHGLLSTSALLDLFEITGRRRIELESYHRHESVPIDHMLNRRVFFWLREERLLNC